MQIVDLLLCQSNNLGSCAGVVTEEIVEKRGAIVKILGRSPASALLGLDIIECDSAVCIFFDALYLAGVLFLLAFLISSSVTNALFSNMLSIAFEEEEGI